MKRKPIIAANWKMHKGPGETEAFIGEFLPMFDDSISVDTVLAPPFVSLAAAANALSGSDHVGLSSQNVYFEEKGAFTGEISTGMLQELGAQYAIIGHSERRSIFGEDDALINSKAQRLHETGLTPIICIGETLDERDGGRIETVLRTQLETGLAGLDGGNMATSVIAYEPVWAIGTGRTATPDQAQEAHAFVRKVLGELFGDDVAEQIRIQYGGSVKPDNTVELMSQEDVDGALVGGASLEPASFYGIVKGASEVYSGS